MQAHIKLGRIFGVRIGLHFSWVIIALLVTFSLGAQFHASNPQWGGGLIWGTAIITGALFFASIVVHELSHALVAMARGLKVRGITLFALGGVAEIESEAADAKTEFWMGIVGPITSALIGVLCLALAVALGWSPAIEEGAPPEAFWPDTPLLAGLMWLGIINIALAIFNMIPGFPMDGGRVLRAIIWWSTGDAVRATRIASRVGSVIALGLIIFGIWRFFVGGNFGGLWLAFIGWFLLDASRASGARVEINENLRGARVGDIMSHDCPAVDGRDNLQTFVEEHLLKTGERCFVVEEQGQVAGIVTPHEVKGIERQKWPYTTLDQVMRPLDQLRTVKPETPVAEALELMGREDLNQLPVVQDGRLTGIVSRSHILRLLRTRTELQV